MGKAMVGVDIGGTNTVVGIFDESFSLVLKHSIPTIRSFPNRVSNPRTFFDNLAETISQLADSTGYKNQLLFMGAGVPGKVDPFNGKALASANLGWIDVNFTSEMKRRLGIPVFIDNDVRLFTLGEMVSGAAQGCQSIIGLTLGTGIAAGIALDGKLIRGSDLFAGEFGHDPVLGETSICNCGKSGCLETIASASGIVRLAMEAVRSGRNSSLCELKNQITSYDVYQACAQGDQVAKDIFQFVGFTLGHKLLTAIYLLNPEMVVIGGGVASSKEYLLDPIRTVINERYINQKIPQICTGKLGDDAGLFGALHFALSQIECRL